MPLSFLLLLSLSLSGNGNAALERALDSVRAGNICADVRFIASDELQGRDTPSEGQRLAARYLRARLERLGFVPAGDDGFFDRYELVKDGLDPSASRAWLVTPSGERALVAGKDYAFFGGRPHELEGELVYVGAGSEAELAGLDLAGKWALALDGESGRGREAWSERQARQERVRAAGALGLVSAPDPAAKDAAERDGRLARTMQFGRGGRLHAPMEEGGAEPESVAVSLSSTLAAELLGPAPTVGKSLGARLREVRKALPEERFTLENVAGLWPGSDPRIGHEVVIVSAHYDHVGVQGGEIYNGADDNGSGTSGLLALAEALKSYGPMRRSVLLLWVSGEEKGLLGSEAWTKNPTLPEGYVAVCDLNIDMIGRNAPDKLLITPTKELKEYNGLTRLAEALGGLEGFPVLGSADEYWDRSDHANFAANLHIPVAFLFSDVHEDYHKPTDDADKIDCDKIRRVVRLVLRMIEGLQQDELGV